MKPFLYLRLYTIILVYGCSFIIMTNNVPAVPPCGEPLAFYRGIPARSNGDNQFTEDSCEIPERGLYGLQYQCVEYVKRFYTEALGVDTSNWRNLNAVDYFENENAENLGLVAFMNGGDTPPAPDDIIVFAGSTRDSAGHIAIVMNVTQTAVNIIEQNWSTQGTAILELSENNGKYEVVRVGSSYTVLGWLRRTSNICNGSEVEFISFVEGDPGIPGDGVFLFIGTVEPIPPTMNFEPPELNPHFSLNGVINGVTVTIFPKEDIVPYFQQGNPLNLSPSFRLGFPTICGSSSFGFPNPSGQITFNGVTGFVYNLSQEFLENLVNNINESNPGCVTLDQLSFDSLGLLSYSIPFGYVVIPFDVNLDALAIGLGQNACPGEPFPEPPLASVVCSPSSWTATPGSSRKFTASGGSGNYFWSLNPPDENCDFTINDGGTSFTISCETEGDREVFVEDDNPETSSDTCVFRVRRPIFGEF